MTWAIVIGLALLVFGLIAFALRAPRASWEVIGAALLLGIAGYALQGRPGQPGSPREPAETIANKGDAGVAERQKLGSEADLGDKHLVIADALARHGQFADAAEVLGGAVELDPANAEAWLAMGNALVGHAEGTISPASIYAYGQAATAAPDSPGPPFFLGMALIQSGRLAEGRSVWADLLARSPADAPWRGDLDKRLAELDRFMAGGQPAGEAPAR
ncbi:MAG: tetratricopeptide repeat protein [Sphingomonadales bacterium]|nr:tetratricopeptide repeat protein [Sphingomonadales bacterium]MBU3991888.1 tetratricopeptide repeat protein [Alphaproteobacteria bacterium]